MSPIIDCMKQGEFVWTKATAKAFNKVKQKMTEAPVMCLLDFTNPFEVECDASGIGIGGVLSQECYPIAYFSEKLNDAKQKSSTYDRVSCHYSSSLALAPLPVVQEFVIYSDHEALRYLHS